MKPFDPHAYSIVIKRVEEEDGPCFFAQVTELPDITFYADTHQEAYAAVVDAIAILHAAAVEQGKDFPQPVLSLAPSHSGRITLRMSKTTHAVVARLAEAEGVSANQWIVEAVTWRIGCVSPPVPAKSFGLATTFSSLTNRVTSMLSNAGPNPLAPPEWQMHARTIPPLDTNLGSQIKLSTPDF